MARDKGSRGSGRMGAAADDGGSGWSFGRFLTGAVMGTLFCAVLFVAGAYLIPPANRDTAVVAAPAPAPAVIEQVTEPAVPSPTPVPQPEPVLTTDPSVQEVAPVPQPQPLEVPQVEEEQVAIATEPEQPEPSPAAASASGDKAWQVHRAAFTAPADLPLIAIMLEAPNESDIPVDAILGLGIPFTIAVVPRDEQSAAFSQKARAAGMEVIAHVPMEDVGAQAGADVIREGLTEPEVRALTQDFLALVPEAIGLSNFGGSAVTPNREIMAVVVAELNRKGHAFVDIRAGVDGAGMEVARDLGTPAVRNTLVLENDATEDEIYALIDRAARDAATLGEVVILAKTSAPVLLGISRWALERNGKEARLAPLTAVLDRRN
ncbi:MAG: divergent polysaccharide deacetylase family protein [Pseudomonadota bacterium]